MNRKMKVLMAVLLLIVGGSIFTAGLSIYKPDAIRSVLSKSYSVIYLSSGEIYIGKLSTFPKLVLTDAYILQAAANPDDPANKTFQLAPLKEALWAPDKIYLNKENIIFTASIRPDSQIAQTLKGK